ncbi:alpha/beta hydrolase [Jiangella aurantiaca]|uniref:Alpha/beta hydrolase n=1 Tax=Jiangella aurantiaca TaxID=2530373 RepID=A0A4V2YS76_9ACTN|nr:alpha/beta hydrolase [Jiangella aurantiaca]TDD67997.1 alpha/beta hydrolase [Jiangella aurantiaca]
MSDPREVLTRAAPPPRLAVAYGDLPEQLVDVWLPAGNSGKAGRAAPLVVVVHGGFWRAEYDRKHARPQCAGLAAAGYVVAAVEYRRVGAGGGWPATFDDVATALDAVPALMAEATAGGPIPVDAARVVHVGHSAGAHLAVWAASRHRLPAGSRWAAPTPAARPAGVVSLAGVLDLHAAAGLDLDNGAARALLGGGPADQPDRYAVADPMRLVPPGVPVVLLHGTADRQVPPEFSRRYAAATGPSATVRELPGVEHFGLIDPESSAWPAVLDAVAGLLRRAA